VSALIAVRSLLFAPGSDERKLVKALASPADAVVADLEDGVAPDRKPEAREVVRRVLAAPVAPLRAIRVNGFDTEYFADDLALVRETGPDLVVLPKAIPAAVAALGPEGPPVIALVETPAGLRQSDELAAQPRVEALFLGAADLGARIGLIPRPDGQEILFARSTVVLASAVAGIRPPFDGVFFDYRDQDGLRAEASLARSLGLGGKACIHPDQLEAVNAIFGPQPDELAWAQRVVETYEQGLTEGLGATSLDGSMVDLPVVERARRILAQAEGRN
jgi:citrate lyase subunit beta/citryl-CoA lyase